MTRPTLLPNYITKAGTTIEDFGTFSQWTNAYPANGTISVDTEHYKVGQGLKLSAYAGCACMAYKLPASPLDLTGKSVMRLWVYIPDNTYVGEVKIRLVSNVTTYSMFIAKWEVSAKRSISGWNCFTLHLTDFQVSLGSSSDEPLWSDINKIEVFNTAEATGAESLTYALITFGEESLARLMVQFDDAIDSQYSQGYAYLNSKGKKGTAWIVPDYIDTSNRMTKANLDTLYAAGWDLGNHTKDHTKLTDVNKATQKEKIQQGYEWLIANGYSRGARHLAYPFGASNSDTYSIMTELGLLTGRCDKPYIEPAPGAEKYQLHSAVVGHANPAITVATVKGWINTAIRAGATLGLIFHGLVSSYTYDTDYLIADFQTIVDYAIACGMEFVTIDEWYRGLTNPRYR